MSQKTAISICPYHGVRTGRTGFDSWQEYVGVLIGLWHFLIPIFLLAAQPKEFFMDGSNML
jgi:hypothetical protein